MAADTSSMAVGSRESPIRSAAHSTQSSPNSSSGCGVRSLPRGQFVRGEEEQRNVDGPAA